MYIAGIANNDLSNFAQGICGVKLDFNHQYLGDLEMTLISPAGQEIELIGPQGFYGPTDGSTYDITFVPCAVPVSSNSGDDKWTSLSMTATNFDFVGSYWPSGQSSSGSFECLEEINSGPVNGIWQLKIDDALALDQGTLISYEIIFCDDAGNLQCSSDPFIYCDDVNLNLPIVLNEINRAEIRLTSDANINLSNTCFFAGDTIILDSGFEVAVGNVFKAELESCVTPVPVIDSSESKK